MKHSKILFLFIAIFPLYNSAQELLSLQQSEINKKAVVVEKRMTFDRYATYGLNVLRFAHYIYPWVALYEKGVDFSKRDASEKIPMLQAIKASFNHLLFTSEGWTCIAQAGVGVASSVVASRICDRFIHPDTLRWYIHSHAPYMLTINIMKKQQQTSESKEFLYLLYNRLVRQVEAICAYQMYKCKCLDDEEKEIGQRAMRTMFTVQQYWLCSIEKQLKAEVIDYQELHTMLSDYEKAIRIQLNHFSIIEGETLEERYVVKQQVKG